MKANELVGKTITTIGFDGVVHKDRVLAFDGENFTLGIVFKNRVDHKYIISPKELSFVYGIDVEV